MEFCRSAVNGDFKKELSKPNNLEILLNEVVNQGNVKICQILLKNGIKLSTASLNNLLLSAASLINIEICRLLVENGASVFQPSKTGVTPLMEAAKQGKNDKCLETVQFFLDKYLPINKVDQSGNSVLHHAIPCCSKLLQLLIKRGAKLNTINVEGWTPLMLACSKSFENALELARAGADFYAGKQSAWDVGSERITEKLEQHGFVNKNKKPKQPKPINFKVSWTFGVSFSLSEIIVL